MDRNLKEHIIALSASDVYCSWIIIVLVSPGRMNCKLTYRDQRLRKSLALIRHSSPTSLGWNLESASLCSLHVSPLIDYAASTDSQGMAKFGMLVRVRTRLEPSLAVSRLCHTGMLEHPTDLLQR
jgi:hypothetical protein